MRRRQFVFLAAGDAASARIPTAVAAPIAKYDLIIQGGRVIGEQAGRDSRKARESEFARPIGLN